MATVKMTRTLKPIAKPSMAKMDSDDIKRAAFAMAMRAALYEPEDDVVSLVEEDNDNGVKCDQCETTSCVEDEDYPHRLLWTSNLDESKNICRGCVCDNDRADEDQWFRENKPPTAEAPKPEPLRISAQWIRENQVPTTEERIVMMLVKGPMTTKRLASILHKRKSTLNPILYSNSRFKIVGHEKEAPIWGLSH
jgi:hypothetical protein